MRARRPWHSRTMVIPKYHSTVAYWLITVIAGGTYLLPYILLGASSHVLVHDNLDAYFVLYKVLVASGNVLANNGTPIHEIFNGLPREALPSQFDAFVLMYWLFGPIGAYVVNRTVMTTVGFLGMYLLLRRHVIPGNRFYMIQFGCSLCYALLPFFPFGGLSVAGLPLVVYAVLNIREGDLRCPNWLILILFPFYSSFVTSGVFLLFALACLLLSDVIHRRGTAFFLLAIVIMSLTYIVTHYRLFAAVICNSFTSHRVEFARLGIDLPGAAREVLKLLRNGENDAPGAQGLIICPTVLICFFMLIQSSRDRRAKFYVLLLAFIVITAGLYGLLEWDPISGVADRIFHWLPVQQRFYYLHPMLWVLLFAFALRFIRVRFRGGRWAVACLLGAQVILLFSYHELRQNRFAPTIEEFFAERQFEAIANYIGQPKSSYRVASLGMHPSIAQYNGFYTLDGYVPSYPLEYKQKWRDVIEGELARNASLMRYYDKWGSRVYLFSSELRERGGYVMNRAGNDFEVERLDLDVPAFEALGGKYVISAVRINESNNPQFKLDRKFEDSRSAWDIYLYRIVEIGKAEIVRTRSRD
jgi:Protein of unknown function (DUF6044)